tara:strand:+ start:2008 stop:2994 length:987 start_codon:yes stop_codon:yes gene_type:complete
MNNIDCDQIILFGLVAIFAIYVYRNVLDPNQTQGFKVGAQVPMNQPGMNQPAMNSEMANALANMNNSLNDINSNLNQNRNSNGVSNSIRDELNSLNNAISRAENSANAARVAANNATNAVNANSAALNANGSPIAAANSMNNMNGSDNTDSIPAIFQNVPEPNADPGGDSVPRSYNVGENKSDSCFPQDTLTAEDLLPQEDVDAIKQFAEESIGDGVLKGIELLGAGYHVGVNSVGQSLRNANRQLRSEPPNPQVEVSPFLNSTIGPDLQRRPLELTESCAKAEGVESPGEIPGNATINTDTNSINMNNSLLGNNSNNASPQPVNSMR